MFEFGKSPANPLERTQLAQDKVHDLLVKVDSAAFDAEMDLRFLEHAPKSSDPQANLAYEQKVKLERILADSRVSEAKILEGLYDLFGIIQQRLEARNSAPELDG